MREHEGFHIRDARDHDRTAIREVTLAAYAEYAAIMGAPIWEDYQRQLLAALDNRSAERIVAERHGAIIGGVLLFPPQVQAYEQTEARAAWPEMRFLAVACAARARGAGATALGLHTGDMMAVAVRMYERHGFVRVPELDFRVGDAILVKGYRRSLDDAADDMR